MSSILKLAAVPAFAAALSLSIAPTSAAELPATPSLHSAIEVAPAWSSGDDIAANHRRYRYRRHRGVDAGDIIAGVLIIGGIAAIASASNRNRGDNYRDRDWRYPQADRQGWRGDDARGLDRAVEMCIDAVERDQRVETVDSVNREGRGWRVTGSLYNGEGFNCGIGEDGRIESLDTGAGYEPYRSGDWEAGDDRQWDDEIYAEERARVEGDADAEPMSEPAPPYPGGPLEGDAEGDFEVGTGYQGAN